MDGAWQLAGWHEPLRGVAQMPSKRQPVHWMTPSISARSSRPSNVPPAPVTVPSGLPLAPHQKHIHPETSSATVPAPHCRRDRAGLRHGKHSRVGKNRAESARPNTMQRVTYHAQTGLAWNALGKQGLLL